MRWGASYRGGSITTTGRYHTAPWGCSHLPNFTRNGGSKPRNYLSKIKRGSAPRPEPLTNSGTLSETCWY